MLKNKNRLELQVFLKYRNKGSERMKDNLIKTEMNVNNNKINVMRIGNEEYISLTDLARYADEDDPRYPIQNWMRNKDVISYLGLWEKLNNENFKGVEFDTFKNEAGSNKFHKNGLKKLMQLVLYQNQVTMVAHLLTLILH